MILNDLSADEEMALRRYKSASDSETGKNYCFDMNEQLQSALSTSELDHELATQANVLDGIFGRCPPLENEVELYRGIGDVRVLGPLKHQRQFRTLSFLSATTSEAVAKNFIKAPAKGSTGALLKLKLQPGMPVYYMESLKGAGEHEKEILLPRGILWVMRDFAAGDLTSIPHRKDIDRFCIINIEAVSTVCRPFI